MAMGVGAALVAGGLIYSMTAGNKAKFEQPKVSEVSVKVKGKSKVDLDAIVDPVSDDDEPAVGVVGEPQEASEEEEDVSEDEE